MLLTFIYKNLFQGKHYKFLKDLNKYDIENVNISQNQIFDTFKINNNYKNEYINILKYFQKFEIIVIFDKNKKNPQYKNIQYLLHILHLAKEAINRLERVNASDKKFAYYESRKNASLDDLINHFTKKLTAKNENKISMKQAKQEIKIKRFIAKLKKHDPLFINFYLMLYTIYPISKLDLKKEDEEYIELFQDIYEFYRIGHATKQQIYKSVAIQIYNLYKPYISKIKRDNSTTKEELKNNISILIDYTFDTDKPFQNFNKINEKAYVKNIVYNFPLFECNEELANKQIQRFKFYFISKNGLVPSYIPKCIRKYFLNRFLKTPLAYYQTSVLSTLFGLFQKKI